ncbi:uncharacterized protein ALTATR162_LOCUS6745 [Alternaria atra]|uniref:Uncharacterized protein n=1 Tax=Alternaria atra TaxID=119953 RepID=A0A8J2I3C9_9PLEO|nr:uncharacterized protein ALTATR162_LOCUS6745 [Alternaria atra]CAG5165085.1 unnamed protein product [Alternaria atra]
MGAWQGPPRNRCMRCFKPRRNNTPTSPFKYCHSCKLAVRWVEPDYLPFEPNDTVIFNQDSYRDYQVADELHRDLATALDLLVAIVEIRSPSDK